ncbi:hypothetical protein GA0070613_5028 [Micromonospora inositola]|uniref:Uncharacterized protein n=1 Tax=Micromonospora inositola TaxID=47865 RepID=A0A1C5JNI3_9ACTN|nr:hypothetical protein GA0070613_5028 [Micromonospora inositola]
MSLLALLGLRHPLRLLPVLLFETTGKLLWLAIAAQPQAVDGTLDDKTTDVVFSCSLVVVIIAVTPRAHVWRSHIARPSLA